jgi:sirohydrochlorin cobaltochelatase
MTAQTKRALILFAHGSSDPAWAQPFERIRDAIAAKRPELVVTLAYLERMTPSLPDAVASLDASIAHIQIAPLFLGVGGHMRNDFPALVADAQKRSSAQLEILPTLGESPEMVNAIASVILDWNKGAQ